MKLFILNGPRRGAQVPVDQARPFTLGRDASCDLCIDDRKASRCHCQIKWQAGGWYVEDQGSANGTWLNGEQVQVHRLARRDTLRVGDTALEVVLDEVHVSRRPRAASRAARSGAPGITFAVVLGVVLLGVVVGAIVLSRRRREPDAVTQRAPPLFVGQRPAARVEIGETTSPSTASDERPEHGSPKTAPTTEEPGSQTVSPTSRGDESPGPREREAPEISRIRDPEATSRIRLALARLEFELARRLLDSAGSTGAASAATDDPLEREVSLGRLAWKHLREAIGTGVRSRAPLPLSFARRDRLGLDSRGRLQVRRATGTASGDYRLLRLEGARLSLEGSAGSVTRDVLDLDDHSLLRLVGEKGSADGRQPGRTPGGAEDLESAVREGLAILLFLREGPERAQRFLSSAGERATCLRLLAEEARGIWLRARREALAEDVGKLGKTPVAEVTDWNDLALRCGELILRVGRKSEASGHEADLDELFLKARIQALRLEPESVLFHAASVELQDGRLRLEYDFRKDQQLEDFIAVGGASRFRRQGEELWLRGEFRLLRGNPFQGSLSARLRVPAGAYDQAAPNVNVALFTGDGHGVTPRGTITLTQALAEGDARAAAYLVFALGYRAAAADWGGRSVDEVRPAGSSEFVPLPAHVLFAGAREKPLNSGPGECLWARALKRPLRGALRLEVEVGDEDCRWALNGRSLLPRTRPSPERIFSPGRLGSLSVFTNGREFLLASLEVDGALSPHWVEEAVQEYARRELAELRSASGR